jgi:aerobic carbon-monoxide dehydrogenase medium subunit
MGSFEYQSPATIEEAISLLTTSDLNSVVLAGGTDLLPLVRNGKVHPERVIDIKKLDLLYGIRRNEPGEVEIGAAVTVHELENDPLLQEHFPALVSAAATLASFPVRCRATIGGNVCHASPSADLVPPLMIYDAKVHLVGSKGERNLTLEDFHTGPGQTLMQPDEILTKISMPIPAHKVHSLYLKHSPRKAMDLAVVGVAALFGRLDSGETEIKIALGAVAPTVIRATGAEQAWREQGPLVWEELGVLAAQESSPIDDVRATAEFRRKIVAVLVTRAFKELSSI